MRRFCLFLMVLFLLPFACDVQAAAAQDGAPAKTIKVLLPTAETTWVVGKTVAVRWIRGKYSWQKVTIQLYRKPEHGWSGTLPPLFTVKDLPDTGQWVGKLKEVPAGPYFIRIKRGMEGGSTPVFNIATEE